MEALQNGEDPMSAFDIASEVWYGLQEDLPRDQFETDRETLRALYQEELDAGHDPVKAVEKAQKRFWEDQCAQDPNCEPPTQNN